MKPKAAKRGAARLLRRGVAGILALAGVGMAAVAAGLPPLPALAAMYIGFCAMGVAGMILGPILLLLIKQLHDGGYLRLWK